MAQNNPGKGHRSLMVLQAAVGRDVVVDHVVLGVYVVRGVVVRPVVVLVVGGGVVIILLLRRLPLRILLVLHPPILEPDLHLPLRQVEVASQLPPLLLRNVGVEKELFLQLERLELRVGFTFLPDGHLARPFQGVAARPARNAHAHRTQRT